MNMNQIVNMVMRMVMRRVVNGGISAGMKHLGGAGKGPKSAAPQQPVQSPHAAQQTKQAMRAAQRLGKMR